MEKFIIESFKGAPPVAYTPPEYPFDGVIPKDLEKVFKGNIDKIRSTG